MNPINSISAAKPQQLRTRRVASDSKAADARPAASVQSRSRDIGTLRIDTGFSPAAATPPQ
jgi:hypothetical protein